MIECTECMPGAELLCEKLYQPVSCAQPNNFCMNTVFNHRDGTRTVKRGCSNFDDMYIQWFQGTSDDDKCILFDPGQELHLEFECSYGCTGPNCGEEVHFGGKPSGNWWIPK